MWNQITTKTLGIWTLLLVGTVLAGFTPAPEKIQNQKGIIIEIDDMIMRTIEGEEDPIVLLAPNPTSSRTWIHGHAAGIILELRVISLRGETLAKKTMEEAAFHMYTGEMEPGIYFIKSWLEGVEEPVVNELVIQ